MAKNKVFDFENLSDDQVRALLEAELVRTDLQLGRLLIRRMELVQYELPLEVE